MSEDWNDPFADDPAAAEREQRRREREERRRARLGKRVEAAGEAPVEPAPPPEEVPESVEPPPEPVEPLPEPAGTPLPLDSIAMDPAGRPTLAEAERVLEARRRKARRYRRRRIAVIAAVALAVVAGAFLVALFQPFHGAGHGRVDVRIPKGATASQIADILDGKGVVSNSTLFRIRLSLSGKSSDIQAGSYTLAYGMSYGDAIDRLTTPTKPLKPKTITVTIPEGYDRLQTAALLRKDGVKGDYKKATVSFKGFDPAKYGAKSPANLEGFLFPATYKLKPKQTVDDLVGEQLAAFQQNIKHVDMSYARSKNLTTYDVLIIASMIEREAMVAGDRAKVAAVIYNRLHDGIPLGIDATIRFVENNYTRPLTQSDLALNSPYNTRTNAGLPPGPISNPGLASIEAAAKPAKVPYLYYNTKPNTCGKLAFATTAAQAQRNVDAYNNARAAAGGKSPTSCG